MVTAFASKSIVDLVFVLQVDHKNLIPITNEKSKIE